MVVLGIDIGSINTKAGMIDEKGAILASRTIRTPSDLEAFVPGLQDAIRWLLEATAMPAGVGVGCKGAIDPDTTRVLMVPGPLHFLEGQLLSQVVGMPLDVPVFADNDARVALAGEMVWGAASGHQNVLMLTLGADVGGAALVNGQLLRGHSGMGGHLGHVTVDPEGPMCACGNQGCLQTAFSARAIEGEAWAAVHRGCTSTLTSLFRDQPQLASCRTVFQAAREGDDVASAIVSKAIGRLAAAIAGLLHVFDPELVIVGGPVADAGADLLVPLQEEVWRRSRGLLGREVPLVDQEVADRTGIVSAAGLALAPR